MAAAQPKPDPGKSNKDLIQRFREQYGEAMQEARVSAEHTNTHGWQHLYQAFQRNNREARRKLAEEMKLTAETLERGEIGEDGEKGIGELKKAIAALREEREMFDLRIAGPVREPVERCRRIISETKQQAEIDEDRAPMLNIGLVDLIIMELGKVETPVWDAETGRVEIRPPKD